MGLKDSGYSSFLPSPFLSSPVVKGMGTRWCCFRIPRANIFSKMHTCITFLDFSNTSGLAFIDDCLYLALCTVPQVDYCCSLSFILHSCDRKQA